MQRYSGRQNPFLVKSNLTSGIGLCLQIQSMWFFATFWHIAIFEHGGLKVRFSHF